MENNITLGGNIELNGVKDLNGGELIILKKILGSYTKEISEKYKDFEKFSLNLKGKGIDCEVECILKVDGREIKKDLKDKNLFFCVNKILEKIREEL